MASSKEYLDFVIEQLSDLEDITYLALHMGRGHCSNSRRTYNTKSQKYLMNAVVETS